LSRPELAGLPELPRDATGEPVFAEPWQAKAFALTVALHDHGAFGWDAWSAALGAEIARDGADYWQSWLRALEAVLADRGIADRALMQAMADAWVAAAAATPHGTPIRLENAGKAPL